MNVIKRTGEKVKFNKDKIYIAIMKAMKFGSGLIEEEIAKDISVEIEKMFEEEKEDYTIKKIENIVYLKEQ